MERTIAAQLQVRVPDKGKTRFDEIRTVAGQAEVEKILYFLIVVNPGPDAIARGVLPVVSAFVQFDLQFESPQLSG